MYPSDRLRIEIGIGEFRLQMISNSHGRTVMYHNTEQF
jgi:hypothetical protein